MSAEVERDPETELILSLDGEPVGTPDGAVICDQCNGGLNLPTQDGDYSGTMTAYATKNETTRQWEISRIYCTDHEDKREVRSPTEGYHEAAVEIEAEYVGLTQPPIMVINVWLLDYSPPEQGREA